MRETIFIQLDSGINTIQFNRTMRVRSISWVISCLSTVHKETIGVFFEGSNVTIQGDALDKYFTISIDPIADTFALSGSFPCDIVTNVITMSYATLEAVGTIIFEVEWI